jgi:hypothetical protein
MKKFILPIMALLCMEFSSFGQGTEGENFQYGGITIMRPLDKNLGGGGFGINLGAFHNFTDNFSAGIVGEGALSFMAPKDTTNKSSNMSIWYGGKGVAEYFFTTSTIKPFVGYGLGALRIGGISSGAEADAYAGWKFVHGPRAGIILGKVRLSLEYSFIPSKFNSGKDIYNLGYLGFNLGSYIGVE